MIHTDINEIKKPKDDKMVIDFNNVSPKAKSNEKENLNLEKDNFGGILIKSEYESQSDSNDKNDFFNIPQINENLYHFM